MKIESPAGNKIVVELSEQDMLELDITYEELDYSTSETRRVIWTLLDRAGKQLGKDIDPTKRMMIEALPCLDGGCTVCFTILGEAKEKEKLSPRGILRSPECITYEFDGADSLLDARRALGTEKSLPGELYTLDGRYRLIFSQLGDNRRAKRILAEYALPCDGRLCLEFTREHWQLIS